MAKPRSKLTEKQAAFVDAKMTGANDAAAARAAGLTSAAVAQRSDLVRAELQAARRWLTDVTQIRRLDVIEGIIDGIEMARHLGDAGNVIKGWTEVAKLLGYLQPETKTVNLTVNQMALRGKFETLSVEELLRIADGQSFPRVIDVQPS